MALILDIKVVPASGKQDIILDKSGLIKIFLKNKPENNKANTELIKFLSKKLDLTENNITLLSGKKGHKKKVKVNFEISLDNLLCKLNLKN